MGTGFLTPPTRRELCVVLVGFARSDDARHPVCVEPEDGPLTVGHLSAVSGRTVELLGADPESQLHYSHPEVGAQLRLGLFRRRRADAVVEAVEASGVFDADTPASARCVNDEWRSWWRVHPPEYLLNPAAAVR